MNWKKRLLMALLVVVVLLTVPLGMLWHFRHYVVVDMKFYPRDAQQLDLRDQEISIRHYEKILRRIPGCEILWNVPFQDRSIPWDVREVSVTSLTEKDIRILEYFDRLETVNAEGCTDYENLMTLRRTRPDLQVEYSVRLGSKTYPTGAEQVEVESVMPEEIPWLSYLPNLKRVVCSGGETDAISQLKGYCEENQLEFLISLGGEVIPMDTKNVTAGAITDEQIGLLQFLPDMQQLHIRLPRTTAEKLLELKHSLPNVTVTWEQEICGKICSSSEEELDLSGTSIGSLETLDQQMAYFPDVRQVFLGECDLDNDTLAAHRNQVRDRYKLVWTVPCGSINVRTDAVTFMPVREHVFYFNDEEAYNLRYCEDMICIDVGHMSIHNIDFVEYMPNLQYLILAHTQLQYIDPISSCKKLKFLELDWCPLKDLTPLKECAALEDLNLGNTFADFDPVAEMTWLKNLWMVDCSTRARYEMTQALPDTKVMVTGAATVANGWRDLDNYYAMRDLLGMHYMSW